MATSSRCESRLQLGRSRRLWQTADDRQFAPCPGVQLRRHGFALVEMLVCLAVMGTMIALLLPAIQAAREAARRTQCACRLRQIGLAAQAYHAAHGCYPPGYLGPGEPIEVRPPCAYQFVGHLPYLLPHLELSLVSDRIGVPLGVRQRGPSWWGDAPSYGIAQARLPLLLCPSASRAQTGAIFLIHYYYRNPGSAKVSVLGRDAPGDELLGATDYLGCGGLWGTTGTRLDDYRGVFGDRSMTRLKHVVDGSSATLLLGETLGAHDSDEGDFLHAWIGGGPLSTFNGLGDRPFQFTSAHPTTVNFAFADGAVRALAKNIDKQALQALGGIADGDLTPLLERER